MQEHVSRLSLSFELQAEFSASKRVIGIEECLDSSSGNFGSTFEDWQLKTSIDASSVNHLFMNFIIERFVSRSIH